MLRTFLRKETHLFIVALCISSSVISGCVESSFDLASESRLPESITLPSGLTRADVSVTLNYYTLGDAKFILKDGKKKKLAEIKGKVKCQELSGYPAYVAVVASGITEIIEHRRPGPIFYINNEPAVRKAVLASCRKEW